MRRSALLLWALYGTATACASVQRNPADRDDRAADREALLSVFRSDGELSRRAWETRDAKLLASTLPDSTSVRRPDGTPLTKEDVLADIQRRMNLTTRIDTMSATVDSIAFLSRDEATIYSTQRFVREMKLPGQVARVRVSTVQHAQLYRRRDGQWRVAGPIQESNQRARWADEPGPRP